MSGESVFQDVAGEVVVFGEDTVAHRLGEERVKLVAVGDGEDDAVEAENGFVGGDIRPGGGGAGVALGGFDETYGGFVRVGDGQDAVAEDVGLDFGGFDALFGEAVFPEFEASGRDGIGGDGGLAVSNASFVVFGPGEEGDEAAGAGVAGSVVEVVGFDVVVVDGDFDDAEAQGAGVEIDVFLRRAGEGGHVVESEDGVLGGHEFFYVFA